jgi:hypothetical protein
MAKKPEPAKRKITIMASEVMAKTFEAMKLDPNGHYLIGFDMNKIQVEDAGGILTALHASGHTDVTAIMTDGDPRNSVVFFELPEQELVGKAE